MRCRRRRQCLARQCLPQTHAQSHSTRLDSNVQRIITPHHRNTSTHPSIHPFEPTTSPYHPSMLHAPYASPYAVMRSALAGASIKLNCLHICEYEYASHCRWTMLGCTVHRQTTTHNAHQRDVPACNRVHVRCDSVRCHLATKAVESGDREPGPMLSMVLSVRETERE